MFHLGGAWLWKRHPGNHKTRYYQLPRTFPFHFRYLQTNDQRGKGKETYKKKRYTERAGPCNRTALDRFKWDLASPEKTNGQMLPSFPFSNTHFSNHHVVVLDLQPQLLVNSGPPRGPKRRRTTTAGSSFLCSPSSSSLVARPGSPSSSSSSSSANQQISSNDRPSQSSALGNNQSKIPRYAQQTLSYTLKTAQIPERTMNTNSSSKASSKRSITQATGRLDVASTVAVAEQACMPEETSSFSLAISSPSSSTFPTTTASAIPADHSSSSSNSSSSCSNNNNSSKNVVAPQVAVRHAFKTSDIIHDYSCYMFKLKLDNKGSIGKHTQSWIVSWQGY